MKFNLKIFLINKSFFPLKGKTNKEIIEYIKDNHKKGLHAQETDLNIVKPTLNHYTEKDFEFYSYCYNQPKDQKYWKLFLPDKLGDNQNFEIVEFSFVLFIVYKSNIYCTVGGSGFNVIQSFVDNNFGIDFYQHFAKPEEDIILKVSTRGVASNISQKDNTFVYDQRISESLEYSEIPKKLKVILREELKNGIFKKYDLEKERGLMEIGSYFSLRKKIDFEDLKSLIIDIHTIRLDCMSSNKVDYYGFQYLWTDLLFAVSVLRLNAGYVIMDELDQANLYILEYNLKTSLTKYDPKGAEVIKLFIGHRINVHDPLIFLMLQGINFEYLSQRPSKTRFRNIPNLIVGYTSPFSETHKLWKADLELEAKKHNCELLQIEYGDYPDFEF